MARIQDVDLPYLEFGEAAAPGTPASAIVRIYAKSDGLLYSKDDAGAETALGGGGGSSTYPLPTVTNFAAQFSSGSTSCAVTVTAPAAGDNLVAVVYAIGRGANSITQTNVTWTQRYTGNGNSQYLEVWTGVAASSAGTTATAAFTGSNTQYVEVFTVNSAASDFTAAAANGTATAASAALATVSNATAITVGSYVLFACSAGSAAASSYGACSHDYIPLTAFGGVARSGIFRANGTGVSYWSISSSAVNYFTAIVILS